MEPKTNLIWYLLRCWCKRSTLTSKKHSNKIRDLSQLLSQPTDFASEKLLPCSCVEGTLTWYTHGDMSELPKLLSSSWESFSISREYLFNTCQWGTQLDTAKRTALGCKWAQRLLPACREYAGIEACCLGWTTFNFALTIYLIILFSTDLLQKANRILIHFRQSECWSIYYGAEL